MLNVNGPPSSLRHSAFTLTKLIVTVSSLRTCWPPSTRLRKQVSYLLSSPIKAALHVAKNALARSMSGVWPPTRKKPQQKFAPTSLANLLQTHGRWKPTTMQKPKPKRKPGVRSEAQRKWLSQNNPQALAKLQKEPQPLSVVTKVQPKQAPKKSRPTKISLLNSRSRNSLSGKTNSRLI